jgi:Glycosyltransferase family 87
MRLSVSHQPVWMVLAAVLCAASIWIYANRVLIPHQLHYAEAHGTTRGNFSDLYPRWVGTRELLLHGQDPYSPEITREAQLGFYGSPQEPDGYGDRNYQQGFYYPVYVALFFAPTVDLPFKTVRTLFFWTMLCLTVATIPLWLRVLHWPASLTMQVSLVIFTLGSLPVMQGLKLGQMSLLVGALVAMALALLAAEHAIGAGVALALATIKPQLLWLLLFWMTLWTLADWRRRYRWLASFLCSMAVLWAASEWYVPHWIVRFWRATYEYRHYTGEMSVMQMLIGTPWSRVFEVLAIVFVIVVCWRARGPAPNTDTFALTLGLVLAITVLVVPTYGPYNQVLLIPAVLILLKDGRTIWRRNAANRILYGITIGLIVWQWISFIALAGLSFVLLPETVERYWAIPFWTVLQIPIGVASLMLIHYYQTTFTAQPTPRPS